MRPPRQRLPAAERMVRLQIELRDIRDARLLEAMRCVPRHLFAPLDARNSAYDDRPVSIGRRQTMSQPYMVAFMTQALELRGTERVLEVGTGSGYQAAVLSELCSEVFSMERLIPLAESARVTLAGLGFDNVHVRAGDGSEGWPDEAPFDRIIVTAAAPTVPAPLCRQLSDNGILVLPVGQVERAQELIVARRTGSAMTYERSIGCRFVPLIGRFGFVEGEQGPERGLAGPRGPAGR